MTGLRPCELFPSRRRRANSKRTRLRGYAESNGQRVGDKLQDRFSAAVRLEVHGGRTLTAVGSRDWALVLQL